MKYPPRGVATGLLLALALVAGCDDNGTAGGGVPSFAERLELLPQSLADDADSIVVHMADLDRAAGLGGLERPADLSDQDAVVAYLSAISGHGAIDGPAPEVAALLPDRVSRATTRMSDFDAELGWSAVDVDWFAETPTPPVVFTVLGGEFEEDRLTGAMGDPEDGIWRLGGEDGTMDVNDTSAARPLGESLRLALAGGRLLVSNRTGPVEDARGDGDTLAEVPELVALAEAMEAEDVYSALLDAGGSYEAQGVPEELRAEQVTLEPFLGVAAGLAHDGAPYVVLAYTHADEGAAEANAGAIEVQLAEGSSLQNTRPWSDLLAVDEVRVDGTTVIARLALRDAHPTIGYDLMLSRDSLVVHR